MIGHLLYNMVDGGSVRNKGLVADDLGHVVHFRHFVISSDDKLALWG